MGKNSINRKKLLASLLKRHAEKSKPEPTRLKQHEQAQNRIILSKMKLARKKAIKKQREHEQYLINLINREPIKATTKLTIDVDENQNETYKIEKSNDNNT